nr:MAG TPA: hypothetical protein [Caudoviricetes sp.]
MSTALGWARHRPHAPTGQTGSSTHHRHSTAAHTDKEDGHHPLIILSHCSRSHTNERS